MGDRFCCVSYDYNLFREISMKYVKALVIWPEVMDGMNRIVKDIRLYTSKLEKGPSEC